MKRILTILFIIISINSFAQMSPSAGHRYNVTKFGTDDKTPITTWFGFSLVSGACITYTPTLGYYRRNPFAQSSFDSAYFHIPKHDPVDVVYLYCTKKLNDFKLPKMTPKAGRDYIRMARVDISADTINFGENKFEVYQTGTWIRIDTYDYFELQESFFNVSNYSAVISSNPNGVMKGEEFIKGGHSNVGAYDFALTTNYHDSICNIDVDTLRGGIRIYNLNSTNTTKKIDINIKNQSYFADYIYDYIYLSNGLPVSTDTVIYTTGADYANYIYCRQDIAHPRNYWEINADSIGELNLSYMDTDTFDLRGKYINNLDIDNGTEIDKLHFPTKKISDLEINTMTIDTLNVKNIVEDWGDLDLVTVTVDTIIFDDIKLTDVDLNLTVNNGDTVHMENGEYRSLLINVLNKPVRIPAHMDWIDLESNSVLNEAPQGDTLRFLKFNNGNNNLERFNLDDYILDTLSVLNLFEVDTLNLNTGLEYYRGDTTAVVEIRANRTDTIMFEQSIMKQPIDFYIQYPDYTKDSVFDFSNYYDLRFLNLNMNSVNYPVKPILPTNHIDSTFRIYYYQILPHDSILDFSQVKVTEFDMYYIDRPFTMKLPKDSVDAVLDGVLINRCYMDTLDFSYYKEYTLSASGTAYFNISQTDSLKYLRFPKIFKPRVFYWINTDFYLDFFVGRDDMTDRSSQYLYLNQGTKDAATVNHFLYDIDQISSLGYTGRRIYLNTGCAPPDETSGGYDGDAAKNSLVAKGFTVYTN